MNDIKLIAENGEYIIFYIDEEFFKYGKSEIEIKVSNYHVRGLVWFSFGELSKFAKELKLMYEKMKGNVVLVDSECNVDITFSLNQRGYFVLKGRYKENLAKDNELIFELETTQPSINRWVTKLNEAIKR
ncbi:hypothetical protein [Aquibacillus albus]|uniref:PH domain-containing protein n=1 Tax=Aquibacillus albus TaxID=1168171 RepID=A0ABS2N2M6_9BACI|nr:hypothetical protein [Aquibacillus albus]MBM7572358.1 hypothetical protein [Aquibacillus albus]